MSENMITLLKLIVEIAYLAMFVIMGNKNQSNIEKSIFRLLNIIIGLYGYGIIINEIIKINRFELYMLLTLIPASAMILYGILAFIKQRKIA